mmetsp:Transcript_1405/g.1887  ORF Transcript_1405/g.1887 Transcript_1405/m.1887 type:complete len:93 (+) Transcript_1405:50-328(+)
MCFCSFVTATMENFIFLTPPLNLLQLQTLAAFQLGFLFVSASNLSFPLLSTNDHVLAVCSLQHTLQMFSSDHIRLPFFYCLHNLCLFQQMVH